MFDVTTWRFKCDEIEIVMHQKTSVYPATTFIILFVDKVTMQFMRVYIHCIRFILLRFLIYL